MRETKNAFLKMKQQTSKEKIKATQWFLVGLIMVSLLSLVFLKPPVAHASEFPSDAQTRHFEYATNGTFFPLATSTRTILGIQLATVVGKGTLLKVYCGLPTEGVNDLYENHNQDLMGVSGQWLCVDAPIRVVVTGSDAGGEHVVITWVDRDISQTTDPIGTHIDGGTLDLVSTIGSINGVQISDFLGYENNGAGAFNDVSTGNTVAGIPISSATSTIPAISNGFTYGETMQILFLILIFTLLFFKTIKEWVIGTKEENPQKNVTLKKYNDSK